MTYNELRDYIDKFDAAGMVNEPVIKALRAVVELHNPVTDYYDCYNLMCKACSVEELVTDYPCPTIQAIQKELK